MWSTGLGFYIGGHFFFFFSLTLNFMPDPSKFHGSPSIVFSFRLDLYSFNSYFFILNDLLNYFFFNFILFLFIYVSDSVSILLIFIYFVKDGLKIEFILRLYPSIIVFLSDLILILLIAIFF